MRILFVAMSDSIHTSRWISQIVDQGWDLHIFPSADYGIIHPYLNDVVVHHTSLGQFVNTQNRVISGYKALCFRLAALFRRRCWSKVFQKYRSKQLQKVIKKLKPDIIHSIEIQNGGYLTLEARERCKGVFPHWIVTNWGSDIYFFGRYPAHREKIRDVLKCCEYYTCECQRDIRLARELGFCGKTFPVFPNAGGFDLDILAGLTRKGPVSERRIIMLKGYQHWSGRALVGLQALESCVDLLTNYQVCIYSPSPQTRGVARDFSKSTGIQCIVLPPETSHERILWHHGRARISIGLSISDGISTSFLEALAMGSFPIQSYTACADEWIEDGKTGMLVPPEDPEAIERALRKALTDDDLVDCAAKINEVIVRRRLDQCVVKPMVLNIYRVVAKENNIPI